jgi:hypothetical protein
VTSVDRLYSLPLAEFTAARNVLAKESGADGAAIKKLEKPSVPAWAVNQLYWHHRDVYNRLISAAEKMRTANKQAVAGKKADVAATEKAHQAAIRAAMDAVREVLAASGEEGATPSSATLNAVSDTLHALPSKEPPGRLTKPLRLVGFEAFAGFAGIAAAAARPTLVAPAKSVVKPAGKHDDKAEAARKKAEEREAKATEERLRREKTKLEAQLDAAKRKEREATGSLEKSRRALEKAGQEQDRLRFALAAATKEQDRLREVVERAERVASLAAGARAAIENDLKNY